jgi:hypothetical protein
MGDFVIRTNDMIQITITPPALVPMLQAPIPLIGTGTTVMVGGQPVCLFGDEMPPSIKVPMPYTSPPFVTPGMGTVMVMLAPNNMTKKTIQGKPMLLKGATFQATFTVSAPAMQPTPAGPVPDPLMSKPGTCQFITTNINVQSS